MAISQHGTSVLFTSHPRDGLVVNLYIPHNRRTPLQAEEALGPISIPGVPVRLDPCRGLVPLGRRNRVPILSPAHPLGGGFLIRERLDGWFGLLGLAYATFNNIQLYRGGQFYWWWKPEHQEKTTPDDISILSTNRIVIRYSRLPTMFYTLR